MAELSFLIGVLGNVISILVFASPVTTFWRIVKKSSTENFRGIPYTTTLLSTSFWTYYGLLKPGGLLVVTVNGAGSVMQAIYVVIFIIYAPKDKRAKMLKLVALVNVAFYGLVVLVTLLALHGSTRLLVVGLMCAALTVGMYASPMAAMRTVVKTKSVEYMPFFLSFFLFLNGGVWSVYSFLVVDYFIGVPNAIGFVMGTSQLVLYATYRKKTPVAPKQGGEADEEKGAARGVVAFEEKEEEKNRSSHQRHLSKGTSLPKQSFSAASRHAKIGRSHSATPYELQVLYASDDGRRREDGF